MGALQTLTGSNVDLWSYACIMLASVLVGWLLPRPKWVSRGLNARALLLSTPFGRSVRAVILALHGALIVRAVWREFFAAGTFRAVAWALWRSLTTGQQFEWPGAAAAEATAASTAPMAEAPDAWHVTEADLAQFKQVVDEDRVPEGAGSWEHMMTKDWPGATYTAWRRGVKGGKTEYKSITVAEDSTAEEFMDFYLDDDTRAKWDSMISEHQLLDCGDLGSRQQVVRWVRTFPFAFLSQRDYVIARRVWRGADGSLYAVTKGVAHPSAPVDPGMVRMESYYSCWRSRTVPCPRGSDRPACETVLLHFEDFRINERLARFAVRHGMAGFVKNMVPEVRRFVDERRSRVGPSEEDAQCYGARAPLRALPLGPAHAGPAQSASDASECSTSTLGLCDSAYGRSEPTSAAEEEAGARLPRSSSLRRLGVVMVASGMAYAIARSTSSPSLSGGTRTGSRRSHAHASPPRHHGSKQHGHSGSHKHHTGSSGTQRRRQHSRPPLLATPAAPATTDA